mgnify:CR=1 FL=1
MPKNPDIKKVLVIGSGPIVIGQAAEFDYAGTQACRSLKEEGIEVVLVNSNPATIMTDKDIADEVYIEPLTTKSVEQIILKEKPDSVLPTLGGQAGLNLAMELDEAGFLKEHNVRLIGTTALTIKKAEDRLMFKETMEKIHEPVAASLVVENVEDGVVFAEKIGYPVVLRPAYTLGGSGGGIAHCREELEEILENGLRLSRVGQVLVERCIAGWKEIEYEVMRDSNGNCITVCNMENLDPVGVHTGDSIVVAPSQTLSDKEYQMLRTSALNIISELKITGGCNVQFALHPTSFEYCVIEVNPRVSRSSALASKATGYPIAKVAAKIALGYTLDEIKEFRKNPDISELFFIIETYLKHTLSSTDTNMVLYWLDELHFSTDLGEYLVEYCITKGHSSLRYMNKVALGWADAGIKTVDQAKDDAAAHSQIYYSVMKALGITGRNLVDSEVLSLIHI